MRANVDQGRHLVLIAGSGRITDVVADAVKKNETNDEIVPEITSTGKIELFPIQAEPQEFGVLLRKFLLQTNRQ